jgi:phage shock protein E
MTSLEARMGSNLPNLSPLAKLPGRMNMLAIALLVVAAASFAAWAPTAWSNEPAAAAPSAKAGDPAVTVDAQEARRLVAEGVKVVDVRTPREFAGGHVPGAVNIPYDEIEKRLQEIGPPSTRVLLYCQSGRRSGIAAEKLQEKGYTQLYDLQRYDLWSASEAAPAK